MLSRVRADRRSVSLLLKIWRASTADCSAPSLTGVSDIHSGLDANVVQSSSSVSSLSLAQRQATAGFSSTSHSFAKSNTEQAEQDTSCTAGARDVAASRKDPKSGSAVSSLEDFSYPDLKEHWSQMEARVDAGKARRKDFLEPSRASQTLGLPLKNLETVQRALNQFQTDPTVQDQALALYISAKAFPKMSRSFSEFFLMGLYPEMAQALASADKHQQWRFLFKMFAEFAVDHYREELKAYREIVRTLDLRKPYLWYPIARSLKRKFFYHAGPTNSGKTYSALQAMMQAKRGLYCGPLRLLAMEIYDTCNTAGTYCNLITGQERRLVPGAQHTSCTMEMMNVAQEVDVAVIDEIQLLGDTERGWAWTRAIQAAPAKEIHLCGDGSAIDLVKRLARQMGEEVEVREYTRFSPIKVEKTHLRNGWQDIKAGDCVVAFSRKKIFEIKATIEAMTGLRACLIYGSLPPETRRQQARHFNNKDNEFDVMVASDAVGMGLNLNIRRVVLSTTVKTSKNNKRTQISASDMRQIAGRAGRRNSQYPTGYTTCLNEEDMPLLRQALDLTVDNAATPAAGIFPSFEHLEAYAGQALEQDFQKILRSVESSAKVDGTYFLCRQDALQAAAELLSQVPQLTLEERYSFCSAPLKVSEPRQAAALLHFAVTFAANEPVTLDITLPEQPPSNPKELLHWEGLHQVVSVWLWLSYRFDNRFPGRERVQQLSEVLTTKMDTFLRTMHSVPSTGKSSTNKVVKTSRREDAFEALQTPFLRSMCPVASQYLAGELKKFWVDGQNSTPRGFAQKQNSSRSTSSQRQARHTSPGEATNRNRDAMSNAFQREQKHAIAA